MSDSNDRKALKSGFWYIIANFATRGISFLTMPIFVRLMTTEEIGQYVNLTTWIALLIPVLTLSLSSSVPVAKFDYREKINEYITSVLVLGSTVTAACYICSIVLKDTVKQWLKFDNLQIHIMFLYILVCPALQMLQIKSRLDYKYKLSTVLSLMSAGLCTIIALASVVFTTNKLRGRILGLYVPTILLNIGIYIYFLLKSHSVKTAYWTYGLKISIPLVFHAMAGSLLSSFDKIMINSIVGSSDTALYSVAYTCASVIDLLWYSINQAWAPWAYEQMDKNEGNRLRRASKVYLLLFGLIVLLFMLLAPEFLWIMGGNAYTPALSVIPPVMCGFVFQLVYSLYVNIETLEKKTGFVAIGTITAALSNIALNYFFIPRYGYVAAAYTTLAGYVILFLMHFYFVCQIKKTYWYDSRFNFAYLSIFSVLPVTMMLLYKIRILRYSLLLFFGLLFVYKTARNWGELNKAIKTRSLVEASKIIVEIFAPVLGSKKCH